MLKKERGSWTFLKMFVKNAVDGTGKNSYDNNRN